MVNSTTRRRLRRGMIAAVLAAAVTVPASLALASTAWADDSIAAAINDLHQPSCANLMQGSTGHCVVSLQVVLNSAEYRVDVDGVFGPATAAAVGLLQERSGLVRDGVVGPNTLGALGAAEDRAATRRRVAEHENPGYGAQGACEAVGDIPFLGTVAGFVCDDVLDPDPAG